MCNHAGKYSWRALVLALVSVLVPMAVSAQTGSITGRVTDQNGTGVQTAQVSVVGTRIGVLTDVDGRYVLRNVAPGTQQLRVDYPGFTVALVPVTVTADQMITQDIRLEGQPIALGGVVVSATRTAQRLTEAPATVSVIGAEVLENSVGNSWAHALKEVKGLDFIQVGMTSIAVNARGFNSSFNNRMLMMEDGRIAVLPENGLPVGSLTATPKVDLAGVEVLVGPGAALYGADASNGVITLTTKDPRMYPGTTVEVVGGNKSYKNIQARHALTIGEKWGFKVAGEYQDANDWDNYLSYTITGLPTTPPSRTVREDELGENSVDWNANVLRGTGALVRYFGSSRLEFGAGMSQTNGVGQTNVGRNQLRDWIYDYQQVKFNSPNWYASLYRTHSASGESFAINRYADAWARNQSLSPDSLRMLSDWPSDGQLIAAEVQNNFTVPQALNSRFVWGVQYRHDVVSSDRQWLKDRLTGEDLTVDQYGIYGQIETPLMPWLNAVVAARYDNHENYDAQISPKAALVFKPTPSQTLRASYNRAFKSPTILQTSFHIPDWTAVVAIYGNTEGFTERAANGTTVKRSIAPLEPEENQTWEVGYRGVFGNKLYVDVAAYDADYTNFMSPLVIIANPFAAGAAQGFAYDAQGTRILNDAGVTPIVLTYYNLGKAQLRGIDAGANLFVTPRFTIKGTLSAAELMSMEVATGFEEATALNAPSTKWTVGADLREIAKGAVGGGHFNFGGLVRHTNGYYFRSGINMGVIPTFTTTDLSLGYTIPSLNSTVNLGISNLYTCSQDDELPYTYAATDPLKKSPTNKEGSCGFGLKHQEMINMPSIGTMMFLGIRYSH